MWEPGQSDRAVVRSDPQCVSVPRRVRAATGCAGLHVFHQVLMGLGWPHSVSRAGKHSVYYAGEKKGQEISAGQNPTLLSPGPWLELAVVV